jgi:hypothetical protein
MDHMTSFGFIISLPITFLLGEEEGDSEYPPTPIVESKT